jgi:hypothetical protein
MPEEPKRTWAPVAACGWRGVVGRAVSFTCYPALLPFSVLSLCDATVYNAKWWRATFSLMGLGFGSLGHLLVQRRAARTALPAAPSSSGGLLGLLQMTAREAIGHMVVFLLVDHPFMWLTATAHLLIDVYSADRTVNRLIGGKIHGPKVIVIGNGPSAVTGEQLGDKIDSFDEVVRFNNFQTKVAGMEKWVGTKTTVHFTDALLSPTFKEYHAPGATIILSLFADRFMVSGTYFVLRGGADLQPSLTARFLKDPTLAWIDKESIERLKKALGLFGPKHPTSGMLAIDHFVNRKGVELPVCIHGFDFFMGPKVHYFDEHEPLYERINDRIGVNMHSPHKEKVYVEKLIQEGKVILLKDMPK